MILCNDLQIEEKSHPFLRWQKDSAVTATSRVV